jgi:hypothetical protein
MVGEVTAKVLNSLISVLVGTNRPRKKGSPPDMPFSRTLGERTRRNRRGMTAP